MFDQSEKTRHGANAANSGQREKSLSAQFPVWLFAFCAVLKSKLVGIGECFFQICDFHVDVIPFDVVFRIEVFAQSVVAVDVFVCNVGELSLKFKFSFDFGRRVDDNGLLVCSSDF